MSRAQQWVLIGMIVWLVLLATVLVAAVLASGVECS